MTCFGRTILRFRRSLLILVVWSPGAFQFVVRPKAPVKGLFVDSKYNPVLEGYQPHPQIEDRLLYIVQFDSANMHQVCVYIERFSMDKMADDCLWFAPC